MPHIMMHHAKMQRRTPAILGASPLPTLLLFALPIILGNIFQQLYNIIDAIVIGKFLGNLPLAGISVASPTLDIVNALIIGGAIGIGVLAAKIFGGGDMAELKRSHSTALLAGLVISVALALAGGLSAAAVLRAQGTEEAVLRQALPYLYIVMGGMPFCFIYNYYASMLRACGESRAPFLILLASSLLHAGLDYVLVAVLGFGIGGVAWSTVLSQAFSAGWCVLYTHRYFPALRLRFRELFFSLPVCRVVLGYAWAAALQQAVVCIGRFLVQGTLTPLGTDTVTGYNMGMRAEAFIFCFSQGLSAALAVCVSQNLGRGSRERIRRFYYKGTVSALALACLLAVIYRVFAPEIIGMFSDVPAVISAGARYVTLMAFLYIGAFFCEMTQGFFRGLGRLKLTMVFSMLQMLIRVVLSFMLVPRMGVAGICMAVAVGWAVQLLLEGSYGLYVCGRLKDAQA